jgi:hypothetical protein
MKPNLPTEKRFPTKSKTASFLYADRTLLLFLARLSHCPAFLIEVGSFALKELSPVILLATLSVDVAIIVMAATTTSASVFLLRATRATLIAFTTLLRIITAHLSTFI